MLARDLKNTEKIKNLEEGLLKTAEAISL